MHAHANMWHMQSCAGAHKQACTDARRSHLAHTASSQPQANHAAFIFTAPSHPHPTHSACFQLWHHPKTSFPALNSSNSLHALPNLAHTPLWADPELVSLISVKHFRVFHDRLLLRPPQPSALRDFHNAGITFIKGDLWASIKGRLMPVVQGPG